MFGELKIFINANIAMQNMLSINISLVSVAFQCRNTRTSRYVHVTATTTKFPTHQPIATSLQQHCNIIATSLQHHCNDKVATFCLACAAVQHRWLTKRKMAREGGRSWHPAHAYAKQHDITTADVTVVTLWWRSVCKCLQFSQQLSFTLFPRNLNTRTNTYSLTSMSMSIVNLRSTESWSISTAISVFNYNSRNNSAF